MNGTTQTPDADPQRDSWPHLLAAAVVAAARTATGHWPASDAPLADLIRQAVRQVAAAPAGPDAGPQHQSPVTTSHR